MPYQLATTPSSRSAAITGCASLGVLSSTAAMMRIGAAAEAYAALDADDRVADVHVAADAELRADGLQRMASTLSA